MSKPRRQSTGLHPVVSNDQHQTPETSQAKGVPGPPAPSGRSRVLLQELKARCARFISEHSPR